MTQEETQNLNKPIMSKEIVFVIKSFSQWVVQAQMASLVSSTKCLETVISILHKLFQNKIKLKGRASTSQLILRDQNYLTTKTKQSHHRKINYTLKYLMNINARFLNKILANYIQQYIENNWLFSMTKDLRQEYKLVLTFKNKSR